MQIKVPQKYTTHYPLVKKHLQKHNIILHYYALCLITQQQQQKTMRTPAVIKIKESTYLQTQLLLTVKMMQH